VSPASVSAMFSLRTTCLPEIGLPSNLACTNISSDLATWKIIKPIEYTRRRASHHFLPPQAIHPAHSRFSHSTLCNIFFGFHFPSS
jgi:hypothetical protein